MPVPRVRARCSGRSPATVIHTSIKSYSLQQLVPASCAAALPGVSARAWSRRCAHRAAGCRRTEAAAGSNEAQQVSSLPTPRWHPRIQHLLVHRARFALRIASLHNGVWGDGESVPGCCGRVGSPAPCVRTHGLACRTALLALATASHSDASKQLVLSCIFCC
jgi:hypothetical protein